MNQLLINAGIDLAKDFFERESKSNKARPLKQDPNGENQPPTQPEIVNALLEKGLDTRPFWKRKTFWAMVISVAIPILNKALGLDMDVTEVTAAISPLLLFIATEQWKKK